MKYFVLNIVSYSHAIYIFIYIYIFIFFNQLSGVNLAYQEGVGILVELQEKY